MGKRSSGSGNEGKTPTDGGKGNQQGGKRGNDPTQGNPNDGQKK